MAPVYISAKSFEIMWIAALRNIRKDVESLIEKLDTPEKVDTPSSHHIGHIESRRWSKDTLEELLFRSKLTDVPSFAEILQRMEKLKHCPH